jgi:Leucine-rich repeat (LRR) protein
MLSNLAFNFNLRRYIGALNALTSLHLESNQLTSVPADLRACTALTAGAYTRPLLSST